jgi:DnaD/phage-associated family protein
MTDTIRPFPGFPDGQLRFAAVPDLFFSELLPAIDDLAELKVTLYTIWRLQRLRREPKYLALSEYRADPALLAGLGGEGEAALDEGLARAVTRGTLLRLDDASGGEAWFFLNSQQGRAAFERAVRGEVRLAGASGEPAPQVTVARPNIYQLYEQNIGLLQPLIADELRDAEATYPPEWVEEAFRIAVERNARNWHYVRSILERWAREGRDGGARAQGDRWSYVRGKYGDRVAH